MATREEALAELYQRGKLNPRQSELVEELARRGKIVLGQEFGAERSTLGMGGDPFQADVAERTPRQQAMAELAAETGYLETLGVKVGQGLTTVARGVGLDDPEKAQVFPFSITPAEEVETEAMAALSAEKPITSMVGETVGEAAPFLPLAVATGGIAPLAGRALATGAVTAAEGATIASGRGEDAITAAGIGGSIGLGAEVLMPVLGKLGRKVFQRVTGKAPTGAMLDATGNPTPELQKVLDAEKMTFDELKEDAVEVITGQKPGANVEQVVRKAQFTEAGVPLTKGELTQDFGQQATEQRLVESAEDTAAEPLRQFKLKQSEAIKTNLQDNFGFDVDQEGTGQLIQDALTGRKKLLRTQKNELYETAAENAKEIGGVPIFTDNISEAMPDADLFEDLAITAPASMKSLDQLLTKYGMKEATPEMVEAGFTPTPLTIDNFERFRKTLGAIERGDQTGAASVAIRPIKDALDSELDEVDNIISRMVAPKSSKPLAKVKDKLAADDIISEISDFADVSDDGLVTVYHRTSKENADKIKETGVFTPKEDGIFFSTSRAGQAEAYGDGIVELKIPADRLTLDDIFDGEAHLKLPAKVNKENSVAEFIDTDAGVDPQKIAKIRESLKGARKTVRQLKTEFSPQSVVGKIIDVKKDGVTQVTEASKIYSKLSANSSPVEETRRLVKSLLRSGEKGEQAVASLQASTMMDLIDAGFGTESRKISGVKTFNPIAFKRRLDKIGQAKLKTIFSNNKDALKKLNNIEKIAGALVPPSGAQPKGSASVILDLANNLGLASIATKIPGGALLMGAMKKAAQPIKTGVTVGKALKADPEVLQLRSMFDQSFPGLASAVGVAGVLESQREEQ